MSQSKEQPFATPELTKAEAQFDPVKHRQDWLKRLADEVDKIEPLMPIKLLPDGIEYPQWVLNVEREFSLVMLPSAKLKEPDIKMTPKRMGALLGHMCEMAVWMMECLVDQMANPAETGTPLPTEEQCKSGQAVLNSLHEWYLAMRRLAKRALCSSVDQSYEDMTDFLLGYADAFSRKPMTFKAGNIGKAPLFRGPEFRGDCRRARHRRAHGQAMVGLRPRLAHGRDARRGFVTTFGSVAIKPCCPWAHACPMCFRIAAAPA